MKTLLEDPSVLKVLQNAKYDVAVFARRGIRVAPYDDTLLLSYVLEGGLHGHGMDELARLHLGHEPIAFKSVAGTGKSQKSFKHVQLAPATQYAAEDADVTLRLWRILKPRLAREGLSTVYETLERPMPTVLADMELAGVRVDPDRLKRLSSEFGLRMAELEQQAHEIAGRPFNVGSPRQIGEILFGELNLPGGKKTASGQWGTDASVLEELALTHDLPRAILDWRQLSKLKGTYTDALTAAAAKRAVELARSGECRMADVIDEKSIVNMIVALLATGGSTNHAIHLVAMARAAGILIDWTDMDELSSVTPLLARVYPNGSADVNAFQAAGGVAFVARELAANGNIHTDVTTIMGKGVAAYFQEPSMVDGELVWRDGVTESLDRDILRPASDPFDKEGGLRLVQGDLGRAVIKISAVKPENRIVEAPAAVFETQEDALQAFKDGKLFRDVVVVLRFQGPKANGMPELHSLSPALSVIQDRGFKVAFVTDGRMSGASGKTPAAIHVSPEALAGGPLAHVQDGDIIRLDPEAGVLTTVGVDDLTGRPRATRSPAHAEGSSWGYGRELFGAFRHVVTTAEEGATVCFAVNGSSSVVHADTPPNPNVVDRTVDA